MSIGQVFLRKKKEGGAELEVKCYPIIILKKTHLRTIRDVKTS